ncbi:exod protein [Labrys miyagiensis]
MRQKHSSFGITDPTRGNGTHSHNHLEIVAESDYKRANNPLRLPILEPRNPRTSELLAAIASAEGEERIYFGDLTAAMRNRAFGILFLLFGIPNCLPMPPGIPVICGIIVALIAAQMVMGRDNLWLPQFLARRSFARKDLQRIVTKAEPWIQWVERFAKPRLSVFADARSRRIVGIVGLILGLALLLPIPIIGNIPLGIPICILGLGLVERDGAVILAGYVATSLGLLITAGLGYLIFQGALAIF